MNACLPTAVRPRSRPRLRALAALVALSCIAAPGRAADAATRSGDADAKARAADPDATAGRDDASDDRTPRVEVLAAVGGGMVHRHGVGAVDAVVAAAGWGVRLAVVAPIRFDRDGLRRQDWDERTDFGRILGELSYGRPGDPYFASIAPVRAWHLGTGGLVSGFRSTIDPDHWRTGVVASLHWQPAGVDLFLDSVLDPQVLGARVAVRPLFWVDGDGIAGRLELGFQAVSDLFAPASADAARVDAVGLPVHDRTAVVAGGIDLRYPIVRTAQVEVTPYASWSRLQHADGAQVGLALQAAPLESFAFGLLGEWRWLDPGYVGAYFDAAYMADRHAFGTVPKLRALDTLADARMGMRLGLSLAFPPYVSAWALLDLDEAGDFSTFGAGLEVDAAGHGRLSAALHTRGFRTAAGFVDPDRTLATVTASARLWKVFEAFGSYARDLEIVRDGPDPGTWRPSDTFLVGIRAGLGWTFGDRGSGRDAKRPPDERRTP
jgi:hypothetical protein